MRSRRPTSRRCPGIEVLATVAEAAEERMRMGDLAEALVITRGGLTKLVDRLVNAGLLERTLCESDRRVSYATLMPAGVSCSTRCARSWSLS